MPIDKPNSDFREPHHFIGQDAEKAYVDLFETKGAGGFDDGGKDVLTGDSEFPYIQIKSSWPAAMEFLAKSLAFAQKNGGSSKQFIPICIGDPGTREEVMNSVRQYGGWVGKEIPERERTLENFKKAKDIILQAEKGRRYTS